MSTTQISPQQKPLHVVLRTRAGFFLLIGVLGFLLVKIVGPVLQTGPEYVVEAIISGIPLLISVGCADEEPPHSPFLAVERVDDLDALLLGFGKRSVDVVDELRSCGIRLPGLILAEHLHAGAGTWLDEACDPAEIEFLAAQPEEARIELPRGVEVVDRDVRNDPVDLHDITTDRGRRPGRTRSSSDR